MSEAQIAFLDRYRRQHDLKKRGEVLQIDLRLLQDRILEEEYRAAGEEWMASEDADLWNQTSSGGL